jgi:hypothetical protein
MAGGHRGALGLVPRLELLEPTPRGIHSPLTMAPSLEPQREIGEPPLLLTSPAAAVPSLETVRSAVNGWIRCPNRHLLLLRGTRCWEKDACYI